METSPPVDNTHNSGNSEIKTSHPVDNTHNSMLLWFDTVH